MGVLRLILSTLSNYGRQCAFAIAPVPAYLPQYWTLCNTNDPLLLQRRAQLSLLQPGASTSNNAGSAGSVGSSSNADLNVNSLPSSPVKDSNLGMSSEAGGDMDRDRDHGTNVNSHTNSGSHSGTNSGSAEGGFSSTSIMILLLSHVFRLQYFFVSAIVSTFYDDENDNENNNNNNNNNNNAKNAMNNNHNNNDNTNTRKVDHVHFDLVMQSIVMIGIQLLLLSAVTRRKRMSHKKKVDDDFQYDDDHVFDDHHGDHNNTRIYDDHVYDVMMDGNSNSSSMSMVKSKSKGRFSSLSKSALSKLSLSNSNSKSTISKFKPSKSSKTSKSKTKSSSSSSTSSLSQKPFIWLLKPNQNNWKWDTVHQHIELLILLTILEYIICRYYIHPNNTMNYITTVKNISVLLESCLALPQMILNYKRKSTVGLSLLMVIGWVLGDLLKLAYFISAYHNGNGNDHEGLSGMNANVGASASASAIVSGVGSNGLGNAGSFDGSAVATPHREESSSDMVAFMIGCLFALGLDSIVMLQLIRWYPTKMTNNVMRKFQNGSLMRLLICKDWNWNCNWNCNNSKSKSKHKSKNIIKNMNMNSRNDGVTSTMKKKRFLGSRPMEELMP